MKQQGKFKLTPTFFDVQNSVHSPINNNYSIGLDGNELTRISSNKISTKSFMNSLNYMNMSSKKSNKLIPPISLKLGSAHQSHLIEDSFYEEIYNKYVNENTKKSKKKVVIKPRKNDQHSLNSQANVPFISSLSGMNKPNFQNAVKSIETDSKEVVSKTELPSKDFNHCKEDNPVISSGISIQDNMNFVNGTTNTDKKKIRLDIFSKMINGPIIEEANNNIDEETKPQEGEIEKNIYQPEDARKSSNKFKVQYLNNLFKGKKQPKSIFNLPSILNKQQTIKQLVRSIYKIY